jgi:hypothetical protein
MSQAELDFASTLSREFCDALDGIVDPELLDSQECYSAVSGLIKPLNLDSLRGLTDDDLCTLAAGMNTYFEVSSIEVAHLRPAVEQILWHHSS